MQNLPLQDWFLRAFSKTLPDGGEGEAVQAAAVVRPTAQRTGPILEGQLRSLYAEQQFYAEQLPEAAVGLWRIH